MLQKLTYRHDTPLIGKLLTFPRGSILQNFHFGLYVPPTFGNVAEIGHRSK